jgi:hypothetical protein
VPPATSPSCGQQPLHSLRRPEQVEQQRAAEGLLRRARFFGTRAPRDKERQPKKPLTRPNSGDRSVPHRSNLRYMQAKEHSQLLRNIDYLIQDI